MDPVRSTLVWSDETYRIFGLTPQSEEMSAQRFMELIHPEDRLRIVEKTQLALTSPDYNYEVEYRIVWPDGSVRYVYEEAQIERDDTGKPVLVQGFIQDLTARRRAEKHMLASEQRFRSVLENVQAIAVQLNANGNIIFANDYFLNITGWRLEELLGKPWFDFFSSDETEEKDRATFATLLHSRRGVEREREAELVTRSGEKRLVNWNDTSLRDSQGNPTGLTSLGADVTEQRRIEKELRQSEATLNVVTSAVQDAIVMIDSRGLISFWNAAAERMFRYSRCEVIAKDIKNFIIPDNFREQHQKGLDHFRATGEGAAINNTVELSAMRKGGEIFPVELSLSAVRGGEEWHAVGALRDITQRKKAADALRRSNNELQGALENLKKTQKLLIRSEKLASLGSLAAGVAHEIKNPLNIISTTVQLLMMEEDIPPDTDRAYRVVLEQVSRATKITANLSDFARERTPEFTTVDLETLLDKTLDLVEYEMKIDDITIVRDYSPSGQSITCDPEQLAQVFLNLANNARDSLREKSEKLTYEERQRNGWAGEVRVATEWRDDRVNISVSDNGTGMSAETVGRLFDPFYTTKEEGKGTGLGLSISYGIVERHGGNIQVSNREGEGATFTITFPIEPPPENENNEDV